LSRFTGATAQYAPDQVGAIAPYGELRGCR
jgi:hypothetical protein